MIVWLASYPRTGSKLLRGFLHQVFDLPTFSEYLPTRLKFNVAAGEESLPLPFIGDAEYNGSFQKLYLHARRSEQGFLIKTHHPPLDDSPAIVMTREGRAALVSYHYFLREIEHKDVSLPEVIRGEVGIGSWSSMQDEWNPLKRPATLFLRFEDVLSDPNRVTELIASFLQLTPVNKWENQFSAFQKVNPLHYRAGKNHQNISEFNTETEQLFWEYHRDWMERSGYTEPKAAFQSSLTTPLEELPQRWLNYTDTVDGVYQIPGIETEPLPLQEKMYRILYDKFFGLNDDLTAFRKAMRERKAKKNRKRVFGVTRRRAA